ncbi:MAG: efflux RND transporter periplasmic adaptor subunit, partial [Methylophagaceae bacterium]
GQLLPGMYARLKLGSAVEQKIILISERAIGTDQDRKFVYVVNADNQCVYREVQLGNSIDGQRIVRSGLVAGDKVIIRGLMRLQPNMLVEPVVVSLTKS